MMVSPLFATHLPSSAWKEDIFQTSRFAYSIQALIDPTCDSSQGISTMDAISLEMWSSDYSSGAGGWQANEGGGGVWGGGEKHVFLWGGVGVWGRGRVRCGG